MPFRITEGGSLQKYSGEETDREVGEEAGLRHDLSHIAFDGYPIANKRRLI